MHSLQDRLVSYFLSGEAIRSRSVSSTIYTDTLNVPSPPARLVADWERDLSTRLHLESGEVEALPLARARARWPGYRHGVQTVADWTATLGLPDLLATSEVALMACRGARYHHDGAQYGAAAFCNLFLSEDRGLDLHFPSVGRRIPLRRGSVVLFDTGQPHAVIARGSKGFDVDDFLPGQDCTQVFLTWELPIENARVAQALGIDFDIDPLTPSLPGQEQVQRNGVLASVCPDSGQWCPAP